MPITDVAAWWGAVIATLVLLWDVYKWRHAGPKVSLDVRSNMFTSGHPELDGKRLFLIGAANNGDRPTTITKLVFAYYGGFWSLLRRKPQYFFIKSTGLKHTLPHKLEVGETWDGSAFHNDEHDEMLKTGYLYAWLYCSDRIQPISVRVRRSKRCEVINTPPNLKRELPQNQGMNWRRRFRRS